MAGDVCGNVMVTDEIWRGDYHCRGGLHITQTKYSYLNNISLEIIYDGGFTKPQRLSTNASGREGGAGERFVCEIVFSP